MRQLLLILLLIAALTMRVAAQIHDPGFESSGPQISATCYAATEIVNTTDVPTLGGNHVLTLNTGFPHSWCGPMEGSSPFAYWELPAYPNGTTVTFSFWAKRPHDGSPAPEPVSFHLIFGKMTSWSTWTFDDAVQGSNVFQQVTDEWTYYERSCLVTGLGPGEPLAVLLGAVPSGTPGLLWVDNMGISTPGIGASLTTGAWLGGAFETTTNLMRDDLRTAGLIPPTEPYSAIHGGPGGETVSPSLLAVTGSNAIVDWVRIELRSDPTSAAPLAVRHALLQRDGDIVAADGSANLSFPTGRGNYFVTVRHRNHLAVMSAQALSFGASPTIFNTRLAATACALLPTPFTDLPRRMVGTTPTLWPGDISANGRVAYTGTGNDRDMVLQAIGGMVPTNTISGQYRLEDVNLDGVVMYTGGGNDRDVILQTIGGVVPTTVRNEQVP